MSNGPPIDVPEIIPATLDDPLLARPPSSTPTPADRPSRGSSPSPPAPAPTEPVAARPTPPPETSTDVSTPADLAVPSSRRRRVRRVSRVIRHLDPWSVFKVALVFSAITYVVALTSGVLLWNVAAATGTIDNVERWFTQFGWESFEMDGSEIFRSAWIGGLFVAIGLTGVAVLGATIFNLVCDVVGGIRVTVLEEEVAERRHPSTRAG